jgi:heme/copper-type cytochrome/quinol oxidase subunit 4
MFYSAKTGLPAEQTPSPTELKDFNKHFKNYIAIGVVQVIFTIVTVGLGFIPFGSIPVTIIAVLLTASANAAVVAAIQMHLKSESATIWRFLFFTGLFLVILFGLTLFHWSDPIVGTSHTHH